MGCLKLTYHEDLPGIFSFHRKNVSSELLVQQNSRVKRNHLGNVLSVISDKVIPHANGSTVDYYLADIRQSSDYSPFGVQLSGRNFVKSGAKEGRFGFNGMEEDDELKGDGNSYDFGARMYDSRLGRWLTIDAEKNSFPDISPYSFAVNNPVFYYDKGGKTLYAYYDKERNVIVLTGNIVVYTGDKSVYEKLNPDDIKAVLENQLENVVVQNKSGEYELQQATMLLDGKTRVPVEVNLSVAVIFSDKINGSLEQPGTEEQIRNGVSNPTAIKVAGEPKTDDEFLYNHPADISGDMQDGGAGSNYFRVEDDKNFPAASQFVVNGSIGMGRLSDLIDASGKLTTTWSHEIWAHGLFGLDHPEMTLSRNQYGAYIPMHYPQDGKYTDGSSINKSDRAIFQSQIDSLQTIGLIRTSILQPTNYGRGTINDSQQPKVYDKNGNMSE